MTSDRKKPGVAFWTTVVVVVVVTYVASSGPAAWLHKTLGRPASMDAHSTSCTSRFTSTCIFVPDRPRSVSTNIGVGGADSPAHDPILSLWLWRLRRHSNQELF